MMVYDAAIIGGGVVGLSIADALSSAGFSICLLEKEEDLLAWASGSNSGILCTGVDASIGTLERALIRDSISCTIPFYEQMNLPMRKCGSLVCQWQDSEEKDALQDSNISSSGPKLEHVLMESHQAGDTHATLLSKEELLLKEPYLSAGQAVGAVHIPNEIVVDPWLHAISYAVRARQNGAIIHTDFEVDTDRSAFDPKERLWTLERRLTDNQRDPSLEMYTEVQAKIVINAAGLWADILHRSLASRSPSWTAKPRRGQYLVLQPSDGSPSIHHPIQPIPNQHTKGIFVFSTLYGQLVVGPTAQEQSSRTDRKACAETRKSLLSYVNTVIPQLDATVVGDYVGIRPATDKRDYQVHVETEYNWVTCSGIRSTGLTASLGIGRHIRDLLQTTGLLVRSADDAYNPVCRSLPSVDVLARQFQESKDGSVVLDGFRYRVTHPLTKWGWKSMKIRDPHAATFN